MLITGPPTSRAACPATSGQQRAIRTVTTPARILGLRPAPTIPARGWAVAAIEHEAVVGGAETLIDAQVEEAFDQVQMQPEDSDGGAPQQPIVFNFADDGTASVEAATLATAATADAVEAAADVAVVGMDKTAEAAAEVAVAGVDTLAAAAAELAVAGVDTLAAAAAEVAVAGMDAVADAASLAGQFSAAAAASGAPSTSAASAHSAASHATITPTKAASSAPSTPPATYPHTPPAPPPAPAAAAAATPGGSAASPPIRHETRRRAPVVDLPLASLMKPQPAPGAPRAPPRPFPPPLDVQRITDALLGSPVIGPIFSDLFELSRSRNDERSGAGADPAAAGPMLYTPRFPRPAGCPPASQLPLLVYLPGIDGTGLAAYRQFPGLSAQFDLRGVFMPPEDRTPFGGLVDSLVQQIEDEVIDLDPSRPVYLLGESFGGLLALELAQRMSCVDRVILVNPATSFDRSPWPALGPLLPALPPDVYRLLPMALSPLLSNPLLMASWNVTRTDPLPQQATDVLYGLLDLIPELSSLRTVLPPATLGWRLQLLQQGAEVVNASLSKVRQRTLLLVGQLDLIIPSASEGPRLQKALPRCTTRVVQGGSHALLQESNVDLMGLIQEEHFYVSSRRLTRSNVAPASSRRARAASSASRPAKPHPGGANFGTPGPIELPTPGELRRASEGGGLPGLRRFVSPIYLSTDPASGRRQLGLDALPPPGCGPVLFVGNHQMFAPDMPLMIDHFLQERGQLLRGLAHPMALGLGTTPDGSAAGAIPGDRNASNSFGRFLETFGAVPVSGRNLYTLLEAGEAALLYPGGVREALKLRNEQYKLIWPRRAEFVRMACKFGATIIPFAGVGAEDCVEVLMDRRELMSAPLIGDFVRQQQERMVLARRGVSSTEEVEESFISPVVGLKPPARFYFQFGAPIHTSRGDADDRAAVDELYSAVRSEVEGCLGYLLRKREQDPYKDLAPRLLYEASWGGRRQAPTFKP